MSARQELARLGGVADRRTLLAVTSRAEVDAALRAGDLVRDARGRYALPGVDAALRSAHALAGTVSHVSAALHWGWAVKTVPPRPDVTLPRDRRLSPERRATVRAHWADLRPDEREGRVTSPRRTLVDCLRSLPFDEALAVADSALRIGSLDGERLAEVAAAARGAGAVRCRRVAGLADGRAANPFESVLRAIAHDVPGLALVPQVTLHDAAWSVTPDLVDERLRLVVEADSFAWHGDRLALREDAQRYDNMVVRGWRVLRFAWEDVMHDPTYVRRTLEAAVDPRASYTDGQTAPR